MNATISRASLVVAAATAFSCSSSAPDDGLFGSGIDSSDPTHASSTGPDGTSGTANDGAVDSGTVDPGMSESGSEVGGGGIKYDVDPGSATAATTDGTADECKKVDLLFVVDNSSSMYDQQVSLINSFPGFVAGIQENLESAESYHVGVITSDAYEGNQLGCQDVGDLVTKTDGYKSTQQTCTPYSSGMRFMDETEPDLAAKFACAARPGIVGADDEVVMRSLLDALSPAKAQQGACNEGFLRQDALLVVVIITDEDDAPYPQGCNPNVPNSCDTKGSGGNPDAWYDEIVSYKSGIAENIVVLSLLSLPESSCDVWITNTEILDFTTRFGVNGFVGDICAGDYSTFFAEALPVVDTACEDYVPPG